MNLLTIASLATIFFVLTLLVSNILRHRHLFRAHFQRKTAPVEPSEQDKLLGKVDTDKQD
jgi:preprotein translocase subunit SecG